MTRAPTPTSPPRFGGYVEALDFHAAYGEVSLAGAPSGVSLPERAPRVGWLDGVHALCARLSAPDRAAKR